jgi:hypothetical protein
MKEMFAWLYVALGLYYQATVAVSDTVIMIFV